MSLFFNFQIKLYTYVVFDKIVGNYGRVCTIAHLLT
jgi:hypothetical protein